MVPGIGDALRSWALCRRLAPAEFETLAAIAERRELSAGGELFREGEAGDGVYLIVSGEVEVSKRTRGGERSLARLGAGSVLGEMSLLTAEPRSASARAIAPTAVLRLPAARFRAMLEAGSVTALKIVAGIAEVLAQRLAATNAKVVELSERLDSAAAENPAAKDERLAELHRALQVWSF
jgi:CRP/FNR family cyclic AMP-dependent transcriptional regulator